MRIFLLGYDAAKTEASKERIFIKFWPAYFENDSWDTMW
jgi:hypothetical protein